jgi:serine/threonine protein kinase
MHAHAVSYIAIDITDTNLNILMEFCPGGSVAHLLKAFGALEEDVIRSYTKQILEVSQFIYANVHGATLSVRTNKEFTVAPRRQSDDMYVCERIWKVHYMRTWVDLAQNVSFRYIMYLWIHEYMDMLLSVER